MVNDIANCAYIALGDAIKPCIGYKVKDVHQESLNSQYNTLQECLTHDASLRFTALYCPSVGKAYLGELPPPNYYQWDANLLLSANGQDLDSKLDGFSGAVQNSPTVEVLQGKGFERFNQEFKLPKKYQNLGYEALVQLWGKLPKKPDGSVLKTKAYEQVFKVSRSCDRKVVSGFIDYLNEMFT